MDNAAANETWYVFNISDMCSSKQPEYVMLKTLDTPCVKYVPEKSLEDHAAHDQMFCDKPRQKIDLLVSEMQRGNRLEAMLVNMYYEYVLEYGDASDINEYRERLNELGVRVAGSSPLVEEMNRVRAENERLRKLVCMHDDLLTSANQQGVSNG